MSKKINMEQQLENLGRLVDKAENYLVWENNHLLPVDMKLSQTFEGLKDIRDEIKKIYLALGGEDLWKYH